MYKMVSQTLSSLLGVTSSPSQRGRDLSWLIQNTLQTVQGRVDGRKGEDACTIKADRS